jgi:hypothetical protein
VKKRKTASHKGLKKRDGGEKKAFERQKGVTQKGL